MAAEVQQRFHHLQVTLVDCDVQRRLSALVSSIEVGSTSMQDLDDGAFVAKRRVMNGPVTVLILYNEQNSSVLNLYSKQAIFTLVLRYPQYSST